jgi:hypothetical protein
MSPILAYLLNNMGEFYHHFLGYYHDFTWRP